MVTSFTLIDVPFERRKRIPITMDYALWPLPFRPGAARRDSGRRSNRSALKMEMTLLLLRVFDGISAHISGRVTYHLNRFSPNERRQIEKEQRGRNEEITGWRRCLKIRKYERRCYRRASGVSLSATCAPCHSSRLHSLSLSRRPFGSLARCQVSWCQSTALGARAECVLLQICPDSRRIH